MNPDQFSQLLSLITRLADKQYAITAASDWPILLVCGGLLVAAIGLMWADLKNTIKDGKQEWKEELQNTKQDFEKRIDVLWAAMRDCKDDCCGTKRIGHDK